MRRTEADLSPFVEKVRPIIEDVRANGDAALSRLARELDKADVAADRIAGEPGGVRRGLRAPSTRR